MFSKNIKIEKTWKPVRELVGLTGSARNSAAHVKDGYFSAILIFFFSQRNGCLNLQRHADAGHRS